MVCTFFGHRDTPSTIKPQLKNEVVNLIENKNVTLFYVGNNGNFDSIVEQVLKELKLIYPHIDYAVVLAYLPINNSFEIEQDYKTTLFPDELANTHPRFAIEKRNKWMLSHANFVITFVENDIGGAAKFKKLAQKQGKTVINIKIS